MGPVAGVRGVPQGTPKCRPSSHPTISHESPASTGLGWLGSATTTGSNAPATRILRFSLRPPETPARSTCRKTGTGVPPNGCGPGHTGAGWAVWGWSVIPRIPTPMLCGLGSPRVHGQPPFFPPFFTPIFRGEPPTSTPQVLIFRVSFPYTLDLISPCAIL